MKIIDISMEIHPDMTVYKNREEKKPEFISTRSIEDGGKANESRICLDSHTGTHIDAFRHFLKDGETTSEIPLERFTGSCRVLDFTFVEDCITEEHLASKEIQEGDIVLLKTINSFWDKTDFDFNFVYLKKTGAEFLADKKIKAVGIDALGIERDQPEAETHKTLLSNGIPIIEGLCLGEADEGSYILFCLPLKLKGLDGAPARAALVKSLS